VGPGDEKGAEARTKAFLVDPVSMRVVWMNDAAAEDPLTAAELPAPIADAVPVAEALGAPDAVRAAAESGATQHLRANLVSTTRGSVTVVASVHRLPDGAVLLLLENAWQPKHQHAEAAARRPSRRRH
jgi:hypothetical protein